MSKNKCGGTIKVNSHVRNGANISAYQRSCPTHGNKSNSITNYTKAGYYLGKNYLQMRNKDTKGADSYYHAKAMCESAQQGTGVGNTALKIGMMREKSDIKRGLKAGKILKTLQNDAMKDLKNNWIGNYLGRTNKDKDCRNLVSPFKPKGMK